jgi:hypothetical protein
MTDVQNTLEDKVDQLAGEIDRLRSEVTRLDADLDESRRLNLRAAELLDMVFELLGKAPAVPSVPPIDPTPHSAPDGTGQSTPS